MLGTKGEQGISVSPTTDGHVVRGTALLYQSVCTLVCLSVCRWRARRARGEELRAACAVVEDLLLGKPKLKAIPNFLTILLNTIGSLFHPIITYGTPRARAARAPVSCVRPQARSGSGTSRRRST